MRRVIMTFTALLLTQVQLGHGAQTQWEIDSLLGLKRVFINVIINDDAQQDGLYKNRIETLLSLELRKLGIDVLTEFSADSTKNNPADGFLNVVLNSLKNSTLKIYAYSASMNLTQGVTMKRNTAMAYTDRHVILADTWSCDVVGMISAKNINELDDTFKDLMDFFANDYLAANPRQ